MTNITIPIKNPDFPAGSGVSTYMSYSRLEETLHETGELKPNEEVSGLVVSEYGIQIYIQKKED